MIHTTKLTHNYATYTDVYLFLKLYYSRPGIAEAEALVYKDHAMTEQVTAIRLDDVPYCELGNDPLQKLHDIVIGKYSVDGAILTQINPVENEPATETIE